MPKRDTPETRELKRRKSTASQQARESDVGRRNYLLYGERVEYCPSQGEIETACMEIKCGWSDAQERQHRGLRNDDDAGYEFPVVHGVLRDAGPIERTWTDEIEEAKR